MLGALQYVEQIPQGPRRETEPARDVEIPSDEFHFN